MNIVLVSPEIPHNTGAIGRTALVTNSKLHLIRPFGFFLDEKSVKRAGLDYWHKIKLYEYDSFDEFIHGNIINQIYFVETCGTKKYTDVLYEKDCFLVFGSETTGLPKNILDKFQENIVCIPMASGERSLNLSVAVGVVVYEALRQAGF